MIKKPIEDKIHIDDLRSLEMVSIDMFGEIEMGVKQNQHHMSIDLSYFEDRIIEHVEKQHPLDVQRIVENWEVPSYNLIKELNTYGIGGDKRCDYVVKIDKDRFINSIVIMTERNCRYVLGWVLEMVV